MPGPTDFNRSQCRLWSDFQRNDCLTNWYVPPSNQSATSASASSKYIASRFGLELKSRWMSWTFLLSNGNEMFQLSIGMLVPRMPNEGHIENRLRKWRFNS